MVAGAVREKSTKGTAINNVLGVDGSAVRPRAASRWPRAPAGGGDGQQRSACPRATPKGRLGRRRTGAGGCGHER
eukprot:11406933-Heterocapsa_arctica.AAC.1